MDYANPVAAVIMVEMEEMTQQNPPDDHTFSLPQQRLLLELLKMSGEFAVIGNPDDSLLWNTLRECKSHGWVTLDNLSDSATTIRLAEAGRSLLNM